MAALARRPEPVAPPTSDAKETLRPIKVKTVKSPCGKFETLHPELPLKDKVTVSNVAGADPVAAAEHHARLLDFEYGDWIKELRQKLLQAWLAFQNDPADTSVQDNLTAAIHLIKGNAPTIGYQAAGDVAASIAKLLERADNPEKLSRALEPCVHAMLATLSERGKKDLPINLEIINATAVLVERKLAGLRKTQAPT